MNHPTLHDVLKESNLLSAWAKVRANKGCAGTDGQTIQKFETDLAKNLEALCQEVLQGTYRPRPLLRVTIPKKDGGTRRLSIPTVRDRVLQTAVALVLEPLFEEEFEDCSFAYRRGRSVDKAVEKVLALKRQGYEWVVDIDIDDFFDEIDHGLLMEQVRRLVADPGILALIEMWLRAEVRDGDRALTMKKGVPQGSPLSPLLSNLYLDHLDEELLDKDMKIVRFADDFLVLCKNKKRAKMALELTDDVLDALRLCINWEKTRITTFDEGFRFLGVQFIKSLAFKVKRDKKAQQAELHKKQPEPARLACLGDGRPNGSGRQSAELRAGALVEHSLDQGPIPAGHDPRLRTLYIMKHGYVLGKESERFVIRKGKEVVSEIPAIRVDQILVYGNAQITTQAMHFCLLRKIPIFLFSGRGGYYGVVDSFDTDPVFLHRAQFRTADDREFCLRLARAFVRGKIANSRVILQRAARRRRAPGFRKAFKRMKTSLDRVAGAKGLDELRGIEGNAARIYFQAISQGIDQGWDFSKRMKQPPPDPVNSMLSYGYTLLFFNIYSLVRARGLNPHVGYLHPLRSGHPALVSDIIEEFRAITVDAVVLNLVLNRKVKPDGFATHETGKCIMAEETKRAFLRAFENKMNAPITHPASGLRLDYRRCIEHQINHLARVIRGVEPGYRPMVLR